MVNVIRLKRRNSALTFPITCTGCASGDDELLLETDEKNGRAIWLVPLCSPIRAPALLAGGFIGNGEGGGEQVLDCVTHGVEIARRLLSEKGRGGGDLLSRYYQPKGATCFNHRQMMTPSGG